jgi:hypothetical protein
VLLPTELMVGAALPAVALTKNCTTWPCTWRCR